MASSKEIYALRKAGQLQEALQMGREVVLCKPMDSYAKGALAWTLYDLIKFAISANDKSVAESLMKEAELLALPAKEELLHQQLANLRKRVDQMGSALGDAMAFEKEGRIDEAIQAFRVALTEGPVDDSVNKRFGWVLHKKVKELLARDPKDYRTISNLVHEYLHLNDPRPSPLHRVFAGHAKKLVNWEGFNIVDFAQKWDLTNLRDEDFLPTKDEEGNEYPPMAESFVLAVAKGAFNLKDGKAANMVMPYLDRSIKAFPENIWLPYVKAKLLMMLNRNGEAVQFLRPLLKQKSGEYWVWSLLAELLMESYPDVAFSSYCKALSCKPDDTFIMPIRQKLVQMLLQRKNYAEAKVEVHRIISHRQQDGKSLAEGIIRLTREEWYLQAPDRKDNDAFYLANKELAEAYLLEDYPWIDACLGEVYEKQPRPDANGKQKVKLMRRVYYRQGNNILQVGVKANRFDLERIRTWGAPVRIKGEETEGGGFVVFLLQPRNEGGQWDILKKWPGVITQVMDAKEDRGPSVRVGFFSTADQLEEAVVPIEWVNPDVCLDEGAPVFVSGMERPTKRDVSAGRGGRTPETRRYNVLDISPRDKGSEWDIFPEQVGIVSWIDHAKGKAHFMVDRRISGAFPLHCISDQVEVGSAIKLRIKAVVKDQTRIYYPVVVRIANETPPAALVRPFAGALQIPGNFGIVEDDDLSRVFVEPDMLSKHSLGEGEWVKGRCMLTYDKKRSSWGWKAFGEMERG